jgi:tetratricopeptide (TPR) repeat protein
MNNYCVALIGLGEYDKAYELLSQINIEEKNTHPVHKMVYYNNLALLCMSMGIYDEAITNYQKTLTAYEAIKSEKLRKNNESNANNARAYLAYLGGEYRTCLAFLEAPLPTLAGRVGQTLLYARVAIAQGDVPTAKEKLHEVIEKGNKLYCVTEARELLNTLE